VAAAEIVTADVVDGAEMSPQQAASAYGRMQVPSLTANASDWEKYRDDQLLSNPGGDAYVFEGNESVDAAGEGSFVGRLGKDLSDAASNLGNFFENMLFGAETHYRDVQGDVQVAERRGLVGSLSDFVVDVGSALSFGGWRPDGEPAPQGLEERASFVFDKIKEALAGDLIAGVGGSVNQMGEDLLLAGWNLVEVVPDAVFGNFKAGEQVVSNVFDNGQVLVDYITDVLPAGEAWLRVHSSELGQQQTPVFYNLEMPERFAGDTRWEYVRNTPFRKAVETIGSLLADVATLKLAGQLPTSSGRRR
jgi:hypothetical protein